MSEKKPQSEKPAPEASEKKKKKGAETTPIPPMGKAGAAAVKGRMVLNIVAIAVGVVILFLLMVYGAGAIIRTGGFSISFDRKASSGAQISLSETADFASPSVRLEVPPVEYMTNIDGKSIPADIDTSAEGSHGTGNYIAYTFYVRSMGQESCELNEVFRIESSLRHAEEAVRITVYRDGAATTYAKVGADGLPELGTEAFYGDVVFDQNSTLQAGQTVRYTVVIWLEGNDLQCRDDIKGGNVRMSLTFVAGEAAA